ncbi:MAG: hypothetical protein ROR55_19700 [Devosia sp.]
MRKALRITEALEIAERDDIGQCATCTGLAEEDERYCWYCRQYWNDVSEGFFDQTDEPLEDIMTTQLISTGG